MMEEIKNFANKILKVLGSKISIESIEEEPEDFAEKFIREVHEKRQKDKKEALDLMESWKKNPKLIKWLP